MSGGDPILAEWLARARAAPLVDALPHGWKTRRIGRYIVCACPRQSGSKDTLNISPGKHVWLCRRCGEASGSAIDLMVHTGGAVDVFDAAEKLTREMKPGRGVTPEQRAIARRAADSEKAGFEAGRAREDMHQAMAGHTYDVERFEAGYVSGRQAHARDEAERLQAQGRRQRAEGFYTAARHNAAAISAYFRARGIAFAPPSWMRWHGCLDYWHAGRVIHTGPAIITPLFDAMNRRRGVHVTWVDLQAPPKFRPSLTCDGERLATKKMFGEARGASMWLSKRQKRMLVGEGLETVAAALQYCPGFGGMAAASLNAFASLPLRGFTAVDEVVLLGDGDSDREATEFYLLQGAERLKRVGVKSVRLAFAPRGKDFADLAVEEDA